VHALAVFPRKVAEQRGIRSVARTVLQGSVSLAVARRYIPSPVWRNIPVATGTSGENFQVRIVAALKGFPYGAPVAR